jgi:ubiquinone/menaquinone biosynthesis C-methylase UbiE
MPWRWVHSLEVSVLNWRDYIPNSTSSLPMKELANMNLDKLIFLDGSFDLVILRGAFFFIMDKPQILTEAFRILRVGGLAFMGGGYGKDIPQNLIDDIAQESRVLNDNLGRRRVDIETLRQLLFLAGLGDKAQIVEEGGVWLEIRK